MGDIESMPFIEAFRQFQFKVKRENFCNIHVSLVPQVRHRELSLGRWRGGRKGCLPPQLFQVFEVQEAGGKKPSLRSSRRGAVVDKSD